MGGFSLHFTVTAGQEPCFRALQRMDALPVEAVDNEMAMEIMSVEIPIDDPLDEEFVPMDAKLEEMSSRETEGDIFAWLSSAESDAKSVDSVPSSSSGTVPSSSSTTVAPSEATTQKCSTCHSAKELGEFPVRGGRVGKTCHQCVAKKKRKAEDVRLQGVIGFSRERISTDSKHAPTVGARRRGNL